MSKLDIDKFPKKSTEQPILQHATFIQRYGQKGAEQFVKELDDLGLDSLKEFFKAQINAASELTNEQEQLPRQSNKNVKPSNQII